MSLLGQRLRQEREARGLALLQIEIDTRIRATVIQALEEGDYENLPPEPFLRGLIRSYANYLRIDPQEMLSLYVGDTAPAAPLPPRNVIKRPSATTHSPAVRPPTEDVRPTPRELAPPPAPAQRPMPSGTPPPLSRQVPPAKPSVRPRPPRRAETQPTPAAPIPTSLPEPAQSPRRLPLAPPSAKPPKPVLKTSNANPMPPIPPETLPPPELFAPMPVRPVPTSREPDLEFSLPLDSPPAAPPESVPATATTSAAMQSAETTPRRIRMPRNVNLPYIPIPSAILFLVAIVAACLACTIFAYTQIAPAISAIALGPGTPTPTRILRTATPSPVPGAIPTGVPTLAATAPPFATVSTLLTPIAPTRAGPRPTTDPNAAPLSINIDATQPITIQIGIDGTLAFSGPLEAGMERAWTAKESLYLRVENLPGATVTFNDRKQFALNFGERSLFERQWIVGAGGKVIATTPRAPSSKPTAAPSPSAVATPTPKTTNTATTPSEPAATPSSTPPPTKSTAPLSPTPTLTPFS